MGVSDLLSVERSKNIKEVKVLPPGASAAWHTPKPDKTPTTRGTLPHSILQNPGKTPVLPVLPSMPNGFVLSF